MVCDIRMDDGNEGSWRATVTQSMLEAQNYDKRELFIAAMDNAQLIIPDSAGISSKNLCEMVKQANECVVEPKDVLTDNVFHYDRDEKKFEIATPQAEKGTRVAEAGRY